MRISKGALLALKGSQIAKKRIVEATGKSLETVYRWIQNNDPALTMAAIIAIIRQETGLADEQILEEATAEVATK